MKLVPHKEIAVALPTVTHVGMWLRIMSREETRRWVTAPSDIARCSCVVQYQEEKKKYEMVGKVAHMCPKRSKRMVEVEGGWLTTLVKSPDYR